MDNKKIAEMLLKVEMDDLNDADMLADYAEKIKECGDMSLAQAMMARAKQRLSHMEECSRSVETVLARDGGNDMHSMKSEIYEGYIDAWKHKVKAKIEAM